MPKTCEEIPVSIPRKEGFLAGTLHRPGGQPPGQGWPAVLMCHGFTGNRIEAHFMFVKTSRSLAAAGLASLRFDFRGSGESSGEFQDVSVLTELADALAAWEFLGAVEGLDPERRGVLGLSLGGAVTALLAGGLAAENRPPKCCVLWSAVGDLAELWEARFRQLGFIKRKLIRYPLQLGAFLVGKRFITDARKAPRAIDALAASGVPALVIHGTKDEAVPVAQARALAKALGKKLATLKIIRGADHVFSRSDWEKKVIRLSRTWLKKRLQGAAP